MSVREAEVCWSRRCSRPTFTPDSLTLNENCDPTVRYDMEQYFLNAVPDNAPYEHDYEGPDDMPSHIKSSMLGVSLMLPVEDGRVRLGTWQGIWLGAPSQMPCQVPSLTRPSSTGSISDTPSIDDLMCDGISSGPS